MANVQLPSLDMAETNVNVIVPQLLNAYAKLTKELTYLLNHLDTKNVTELHAEKIVAGSIEADKLAANSVTAEKIVAGAVQADKIAAGAVEAEKIAAGAVQADKIAAGAVETDKLAAGAVTAEKITVNQLSAIAADLGHITAGLIESIQIFGSYIATRNGAYPRAEMSNEDDLFAAYLDAENHVKIQASIAGSPAIRFTRNGVVVGSLNTTTGNLEIWVPDVLSLTAPQVKMRNPYQLEFSDLESSLGDLLDELRDEINSKADIYHSHSVTIPDHNHGNPANATSGGGTFPVT